MRFLSIILIGMVLISDLWAQVNYSAHDQISSNPGFFGYGTNSGYFPPHNNVTTSNLAAGNPAAGVAGAGCRSYRSALPDNHLTTWGLTIDLANWQHYDQIGLKNNVAFIGYPHPSHQDPRIYCPVRGAQSGMFKGLYEPIWDGGLHGTAINDSNYYAAYLWKMVPIYKPYVKYWEIWNEPDFDNGSYGWRGPSDPQSWWNRDDFGCELVRFNGSIYEYIRLLRISWEVIKTLDSTASITTGGIGYESFLDAILRNTDNPVDGSVTQDYPLTGGAYFDVLSYHVYPQFEPETRYYDLNLGAWVNRRHSDGAADGVVGKKQRFEQVLLNRGYDGITYPEKRWIVTEHNIGRRPFGTSIGGEETQRNYQIKSLILQQLAGIEQSYVYGLSELESLGGAGSTFDLMGLYSTIVNQPAYSQPLNPSGLANQSMEQVLYRSLVDPARTQTLNLPAGVKGAAFIQPNGDYTYVLWAETSMDQSETATASYSFPPALGIGQLIRQDWNVASSGLSSTISPNAIILTGDPVFLTSSTTLPVDLNDFDAMVEGREVALSWHTFYEAGNSHFTLERSLDGQLFESFQQIPSKGDSDTGWEYQSRDLQPHKGKSYYRLKQTDLDGKVTLFPKVEVFVDDVLHINLNIYPNPVVDPLIAICQIPPGIDQVQLMLQDLNGKRIVAIEEGLHPGIQEIQIPIQGLSPGTYALLLRAHQDQVVKKVLIR